MPASRFACHAIASLLLSTRYAVHIGVRATCKRSIRKCFRGPQYAARDAHRRALVSIYRRYRATSLRPAFRARVKTKTWHEPLNSKAPTLVLHANCTAKNYGVEDMSTYLKILIFFLFAIALALPLWTSRTIGSISKPRLLPASIL
jgi:hypothetical protein